MQFAERFLLAHLSRSRVGVCGSFHLRCRSAHSRESHDGRTDVDIGAQNVHWEPKGAFTGEISIPMVMEAGARAVLVGHSERRHLFGETDEQVAERRRAALKARR